MKQQKGGAWGRIALLSAAVIWGSSFFVLKNSLDAFPPFTILAIRFGVAFALLSAIFWRQYRLLNKGYLWRGMLIGLCLFGGYGLQTLGLTETSPGTNAFLTAVYCVLVPFLSWALERRAPAVHHFAGAAICLVGIGLVSLQGSFRIGLGDALTLLGGVFYALQIITTGHFTRERSPILLVLVQFATVTLLCGASALVFGEHLALPVPKAALGELAYLALFPTAVALLLQNWGQKHTPPTVAGILLSLEAVFGVVFSMLFYGEQVGLQTGAGFALIFAAVLVSEAGGAWRNKRRQSAR